MNYLSSGRWDIRCDLCGHLVEVPLLLHTNHIWLVHWLEPKERDDLFHALHSSPAYLETWLAQR